MQLKTTVCHGTITLVAARQQIASFKRTYAEKAA